jgi:hypothetical protein
MAFVLIGIFIVGWIWIAFEVRRRKLSNIVAIGGGLVGSMVTTSVVAYLLIAAGIIVDHRSDHVAANSSQAPQMPSANSQVSSSPQSADNNGNLPAECNDKRIGTSALFARPDDDQAAATRYTTRGSELLSVLANGNYEVLGGSVKTMKDGTRYCMVRVHIAGAYNGTSYEGTYYAMAL